DDVLLLRADVDLDEADLQRALAVAQPVLRTDPAAHLWQRVHIVAEHGRLRRLAFLHQPQPARDVVVHRATGLAVGVAAVEAAAGLVRGRVLVEAAVQLVPVAGGAQLQRDPPRHLARQVQKLEHLLPAHAACLMSSASASMLAALGLTSQNLPRKSRDSSRMRALQALPVRRACRASSLPRCWRWLSRLSAVMRRMSISSWL